MAIDEGVLALLRDDLQDVTGIREQKMFGGVCFMKDGHMLCGTHKNGALYRVGKPRHAAALAIDGAGPMTMTGRPMAGFVDVGMDALADDTNRAKWLALALENAASLPPK